MLKTICAILMVAGGVNWGLVGLFSFDVVAWLCYGAATVIARIIYILVALASIGFLIIACREREHCERERRN